MKVDFEPYALVRFTFDSDKIADIKCFSEMKEAASWDSLTKISASS